LYYVDTADWLRGVGLTVVEVDSGWKTRARSSGGFSNPPLGIQWHHTASKASPESDYNWQAHNCDDAPVGNMTIMRDGSVWMIAAGAANTAGKGGPVAMSRGTVPVDSGNSTTWAIEVANNGVGEPWPVVQINAYFVASNEMNRRFGNQPTDVFTHAIGEGNGWTDRKVDPATANAVQGSWKPRSVNGSGTWSLTDIRNECAARAGHIPPPPNNGDDDEMLFDGFWRRDNSEAVYAIWKNGTKQWITDLGYLNAMTSLMRINGADDTQCSVRVQNDPAMFAAFGLVIGPREPNTDEWGNRV
jgi:hypothetical protein